MSTIFALASGAVPAGVAVVRVAGPGAFAAAEALGAGVGPARVARLRRLRDPGTGAVLDSALVIRFAGPASFTGDDVVELHLHGGPAVVAGVLAALGAVPGLRPAVAGEFSRRAFENGRLDLTQVEALSDLIVAETEAQRDQALGNADGGLRAKIEAWREAVLDLLAEAEAEIDFAESEDDVRAGLAATRAGVAPVLAAMREALAGYGRAREIRDGVTVAIVGPPNAGKSSLFNALLGRQAAIVTPVAGTTRDVLEARLNLGGALVALLDTAGVRESDDVVEREGVARAVAAAEAADLRLDMRDGAVSDARTVAVVARADVTGVAPGEQGGVWHVSGVTGAGVDALVAHLAERVGARPGVPGVVTHARQAAAVEEAVAALGDAGVMDPVLRADALQRALAALERLQGRRSPEELLGRIFGRFCVGK